MKLIFAAVSVSVSVSVSLSGCGLILDPRSGDSGEALDADEADASMDAPGDAFTTLDAPALDARDDDALHADGGTDAAMEDAFVETDARMLDVGIDASFHFADAGPDAFEPADAARDALALPDAFDPRTRTIEVSAVDVDVTADGLSVVVATSAQVRYYRWAPGGWQFIAVTSTPTARVAMRDDGHVLYERQFPDGASSFRSWNAIAAPVAHASPAAPTLFAAENGIGAIATPSGPIYTSALDWSAGGTQRPIPVLGCQPWIIRSAETIQSLAVVQYPNDCASTTIAAGIEALGLRRVEVSNGSTIALPDLLRRVPCYGLVPRDAELGPPLLGSDVALLDAPGLVLATTTRSGPMVAADSYYIPPTGRPALSVALGRGFRAGAGPRNVVLAWTEDDRARISALPELNPVMGASCVVALPPPTVVSTVAMPRKVRISDCNADGDMTVVVLGASQVEMVRMACPAAPPVTSTAL